MAEPRIQRHRVGVASPVVKLQVMVAELRRQTDASVSALHMIRARTSKVLAATEAFSALSAEVAALTRSLRSPPTVTRLNKDAAERALVQQELHLLIDQLDSFRQRYAAELSNATPLPPKRKKPWWRVFR
jgi:hypothetical protein